MHNANIGLFFCADVVGHNFEENVFKILGQMWIYNETALVKKGIGSFFSFVFINQ